MNDSPGLSYYTRMRQIIPVTLRVLFCGNGVTTTTTATGVVVRVAAMSLRPCGQLGNTGYYHHLSHPIRARPCASHRAPDCLTHGLLSPYPAIRQTAVNAPLEHTKIYICSRQMQLTSP